MEALLLFEDFEMIVLIESSVRIVIHGPIKKKALTSVGEAGYIDASIARFSRNHENIMVRDKTV